MMVNLPDGIITENYIYDVAKIGELTGKQQNYLMDVESLSKGVHHIDKLLGDLVLGFYTKEGLEYKGSVSEGVHKVSTADIETLLIKVRESTFGPIYFLKAKCPNCDTVNDMKLDLSALEVTSPNQKIALKEIKLPKSGKMAQLKLLNLNALHKSYNIFKSHKAELFTTISGLVLHSLDGKVNPTPEDVGNLHIMDIKAINEEFNTMGGKVDTTITHQCKECGKDFDTNLEPGNPNFFSLT